MSADGWEPPPWTVGDRIRKVRVQRGLEQRDLARLAGVSPGTVRNYEGDRTTRHVGPVLAAIAAALGVPLEWLRDGDPR